MRNVPTYNLYGENSDGRPEFWLHAESIASRSSLHRWEIKPHRHGSLFQILHIRAGTGEVLFDSRWRPLAAPCVVVVPEKHEHGFRFSRDIDGAVMTMVTDRFPACRPGYYGNDNWLSAPHHLHVPAGHPDGPFLIAMLDRIEREILLGTAGPVALIESLLTSALLLIPRILGESPGSALDRDRTRFAELERMIRDGFRMHLPVETYARRLGMTATHLNRLTNAVAGKPVSRLIDERIMTEAKRDLAFTAISIRQIAESLGFDDQAYFSRFFTRHAGVSPRAWRDRERAD
ncbi:helix-turn-helix domain-containing protein [Ciceribacter sp. L1K23]|uniref:helix-turn-helix domain-containing protein n=1 Tax=Ciceribacter sp. L1K23 TaxID=2820276 RepID=UPI001B820977|nr:helix-turn-helix domain-containing protein [Ciceribacter sp. L1K23]MBR0554828.1 helix-turn-helix domain-containing protein [Ciceribacter sp. L1K23]